MLYNNLFVVFQISTRQMQMKEAFKGREKSMVYMKEPHCLFHAYNKILIALIPSISLTRGMMQRPSMICLDKAESMDKVKLLLWLFNINFNSFEGIMFLLIC